MSEAYRDLTIIQPNRTRVNLLAPSKKSIQSVFQNILADEGSSERSVKVASKKNLNRYSDGVTIGITINQKTLSVQAVNRDKPACINN